MRRLIFGVFLVALLLPLLAAQTSKSPYAGEEAREIKSLSTEKVAMYLRGAGMGLAKAAELNRYPGPMHVLELSSELGLSDEQQMETEELFAETKAEARKLGEEIVELERRLDEQFAGGKMSEADLSRMVKTIGEKDAELRIVHLRAHIRQRAILSHEQTNKYVQLRGYEQ